MNQSSIPRQLAPQWTRDGIVLSLSSESTHPTEMIPRDAVDRVLVPDSESQRLCIEAARGQPPSHGTGSSLHDPYPSTSFVLLTITAGVYTTVFHLFSLSLPPLSVGEELVEELDTRQMTIDMYPVVPRCQRQAPCEQSEATLTSHSRCGSLRPE
jgi:hypothetical protein